MNITNQSQFLQFLWVTIFTTLTTKVAQPKENFKPEEVQTKFLVLSLKFCFLVYCTSDLCHYDFLSVKNYVFSILVLLHNNEFRETNHANMQN